MYKNIEQDKDKLGAEASNRLISELNKTLPTLKLQPVTVVDATVRSATTAAHTVNGMVEGVY